MPFTKSCIWFKMNAARNICSHCPKKIKFSVLYNKFEEYLLYANTMQYVFLEFVFLCVYIYVKKILSSAGFSGSLKFVLRENYSLYLHV